MQDQLMTRHAQLKAEFDKGQARLAELEGQVREVQHTLLRISGAIQVLEELMLAEPVGIAHTGADSDHAAAGGPPFGITATGKT